MPPVLVEELVAELLAGLVVFAGWVMLVSDDPVPVELVPVLLAGLVVFAGWVVLVSEDPVAFTLDDPELPPVVVFAGCVMFVPEVELDAELEVELDPEVEFVELVAWRATTWVRRAPPKRRWARPGAASA
jgi:hypothetical protein